ncbi:MAG: heavy-metal-associated domain-containing protein [Myxococcales bacterium]|nr:heavy-metal-associated domain-containing protein [Myxococcales bacterium]MCB9736243.1 heavy-metal-associated domain-containing protein [Deltaproteobacteria bacterium]
MIQNLKRSLVKAAVIGAVGLAAPAAVTGVALACGDHTATPGKAVPTDAAKVTIPVQGMTCGGCAMTVHNALMAIDGVYDATVDFEKGTAVIAFDAKKVQTASLTAAIDKAGYKSGKPTT